MSATVKVCLHGNLKQFGGPFDWGVTTPQAAIRALCVMRPGFQAALGTGRYKVIRGSKKTGAHLTENMLGIKLSPGSEFHLVPVAAGSGGGVGKVILGAVLVAAAFATAGTSLVGVAGAGGEGLFGAVSSGVAFGAGVALKVGAFLILDGVSQLLSPTHKSVPADADKSFTLSPPGNMAAQGNPVPLVYGLIRTGSVQVSAGYSTNNIALDASAPSGSPYVINDWTGDYVPVVSSGEIF